MTKNTYNPYEIMMDKYDKEEMLSDVREAMLYQLGADVSCEELDHFFTGKGKAALSGCAEWRDTPLPSHDRELVQVISLIAQLPQELIHTFNDNYLTIHSRPAHKLALGHMSCIRLAADAVLFPPGNAGADKLILSHGARYLCLPA